MQTFSIWLRHRIFGLARWTWVLLGFLIFGVVIGFTGSPKKQVRR